MTSVAGCSRTPSGTAGTPTTRCSAPAAGCAGAVTGSPPSNARRSNAAFEAGDPGGQVTAAWLAAQNLMAGYAHPDLTTGRAAAKKVITTAKTCPVPEIARLGRTLAVWRTEFLARFDRPNVSNRPTENLHLKIKNTKRAARGTAACTTTDCDYCSTTDSSVMIKPPHGSEPARTRTPRMVA